MSRSNYFQAVPAVVRTLGVFEKLAAEQEGLTLAALSRVLDVNRSSLLAILNTLTGRGYLRREPESGRYFLGPCLVPLADAIESPMVLEREFTLLAGRLAEVTGETSMLWTIDDADTVLMAGQESSHTLRLVPQFGERRPADASIAGRVLLAALPDLPPEVAGPWVKEIRANGIGTSTESDEAVLQFVVAPVLGFDGKTIAALGVGGPNERMVRTGMAEIIKIVRQTAAELSSRLGCPDYRPYRTLGLGDPSTAPLLKSGWSVSRGALSTEELDQFLTGRHLTRIACIKTDGYPYTVPAWYEWDGTGFWIMPRAHAEWARYLQDNSRVSMTIDEADPPLRRVLVEGHAEVVEEASLDGQWREILARVANRYLGTEAERYLELALRHPHWLFRIEPEQLRSWRGLASHPRYADPPSIGAA